MNTDLSEINSILSICDVMIEKIRNNGILKAVDPDYEDYKDKIKRFLKSRDMIKKENGPYAVLQDLYFHNDYSVYLCEAEIIKSIIINLKHTLFPESFEKIFISHREKDKEQVSALIELLYAIGIPRPTQYNKNKVIFCTSHPDAYIDNGLKNLDEIKNKFSSTDHTFYILWYTENYFESQACLNEAGAIWAMNKKYQEILMPGFDSATIGGLMDKQQVWFRANDKSRLNTFKLQLESMFALDPLEMNAWETARDAFIKRIEEIAKA